MNSRWYLGLALAGAVALLPAVRAQSADAPAALKTLGLAEVKVGKALAAGAKDAAQGSALGRVAEALGEQLADRLQNTRKFKVIARSDLDAIFKEQGLAASPDVDAADKTKAQSFKVSGIQYLLVAAITDFQDHVETATFEGTGEKAEKRVVRLGCVCKLFDTTTGAVVESASFQLGPGDPDYRRLSQISEVKTYSTRNGTLSDRLLVGATAVLAERLAGRIVDALFPARVVAKTGDQVTINRGDGTGIAAGQVWRVFALGAEMTDPDTGASLGREEVEIGSVRVVEVTPRFARAQILEDRGIDKGQVLRSGAPPAPAPAKADK